MILETINKLICEKNKTSFVLFDKYFKLLEFDKSIIDVVDDERYLSYGEDIRELIWLFIGLEENMYALYEENTQPVHIPMVIKNDNYYDLDIETFLTPEGEKLFIAFFIQKSKKSIDYINMIKAINKKTLIYETKNNDKYNSIEKQLINFVVDLEGSIVDVSDALLHFFNVEKDKILGTHFSTFFQTRDSFDEKENIILTAKNSMDKTVFFHANIIPLSNNDVVYENLIVCQDITYLHQVKKKLEYVSELDTLTNLINSDYLLKEIDKKMYQKKPFSLALIDIKDFSQINEEYGHHAGDMLLKHIASNLKDILRENDIIARISGDHFVILFDTSYKNIEKTLKRIENMAEEYPFLYSQEDKIEYDFLLTALEYTNDIKSSKELLDMLQKKIAHLKVKRK